MPIVDSQIHIWEDARMSPQHRQIPTYSMDDALEEMAEDAELVGVPANRLHREHVDLLAERAGRMNDRRVDPRLAHLLQGVVH